MKKKDKILTIILVLLAVVIGIEGYLLLKSRENDDVGKKDPDVSENAPVGDQSPVFRLNEVVTKINSLNKLLVSDNISSTEYIEDEDTHIKYYKYMGDDVYKYAVYLQQVYINFNNAYFKLLPNEEKRSYYLYVAKPENCNSVIELEVNDITYDEFNDEIGYANVYIKKEDVSFEFEGRLEKGSGNSLSIVEPFNPCMK